jgi:glucose-6-phosphate 1-dehydrogenase
MEENPFREADLSLRNHPESCILVIFGATGDLTHRKLIPALYNLAADGDLPAGLRVVGVARREKSDEEFRRGLEDLNREVSRQGHNDDLWARFSQNITYHTSEFSDQEGYLALKTRLDEMEAEGASPNRLYYLASAPEFFDDILLHLRQSGLNHAKNGWCRAVVEKPFGTDLATAQHLNQVVNDTFAEEHTYRIDHYLGKETAQNIMVLRFANQLFEVLWNNRFIDHVQITCAEHLGMEGGRGGYYDKSGAMRDMVQNHLLQLLSLVAMEPPADLSADGVRDEKVKVLKCLRPFRNVDEVAANVVRAQYTSGTVNGAEVPGYRREDRVNPGSMTESYVALKIMIDNWRWAGVPFYMRMGKRLPRKGTEISIHFKEAPKVLFNAAPGVRGDAGERPRHPHPTERGHLARDPLEAPRTGRDPAGGENGFPLPDEFRQGQSRGLRATPPRCDGRRRDALRPEGRGRDRVALRRPDRERLAPVGQSPEDGRVSRRLLGAEGGRRTPRTRAVTNGGDFEQTRPHLRLRRAPRLRPSGDGRRTARTGQGSGNAGSSRAARCP